jgi:hypothetical protein
MLQRPNESLAPTVASVRMEEFSWRVALSELKEPGLLVRDGLVQGRQGKEFELEELAQILLICSHHPSIVCRFETHDDLFCHFQLHTH